jgi:hypothetical protein
MYTFRNRAWVERFINYSKEDVIAELEKTKARRVTTTIETIFNN